MDDNPDVTGYREDVLYMGRTFLSQHNDLYAI